MTSRVESHLAALTAASKLPVVQYVVVTPPVFYSNMPAGGRTFAVGFPLMARSP
jgi:hypothetical protein